MEHPYPVVIDLSKKQVAVIGGGHVAVRKVKGLLAAHANVTVISPQLDAAIDQDAVTWKAKKFEPTDIKEMDMIIICTSDSAVNRMVVEATTHFQLVNDASDKSRSDFYNVARVESSDLLLTVSTKGASPSKAKLIKNKLKEWLNQNDWFNGKES